MVEKAAPETRGAAEGGCAADPHRGSAGGNRPRFVGLEPADRERGGRGLRPRGLPCRLRTSVRSIRSPADGPRACPQEADLYRKQRHGQFERLLRRELGLKAAHRILKCNGECFTVAELSNGSERSWVDGIGKEKPHAEARHRLVPGLRGFPDPGRLREGSPEVAGPAKEHRPHIRDRAGGEDAHYLPCSYFNGLHGRSLPLAVGIKLARPI